MSGNLLLPSVRDVLLSVGEQREWVVSLGETIQHILNIDPAVAASRATDMASNQETGQAVEHLLVGYIGLRAALAQGKMTLWQKGTLVQLLTGMLRVIEQDVTRSVRQ